MFGKLPKALNVNGIEYEIRSDYIDCLNIFRAIQDPDLTKVDKLDVLVQILFVNWDSIPEEYQEEALSKAIWFLNGGKDVGDSKAPMNNIKLFDWEQDEQLIFAAVNKVAGKEVRDVEHMHFWTFLGYFNEIGDGLFSTVVHIRDKKNKGKMDKVDKEFYLKNKDLIDLKRRYSEEQKAEMEAINNMLNG